MARKKATKKRVTKKRPLKMGRPTLYRPAFCQQLLDHFDVEPNREVTRINKKTGNEYTELVANNFPTLAGFARKIGVGTSTLWLWTKAHPDFMDATTRTKAIAEDILVINGMHGLCPSNFAIFVGKNYTDLKDVQETKDITDDKPLRTPEERYARIAQLEEDIKNLEAAL